jgi:citrate synthase
MGTESRTLIQAGYLSARDTTRLLDIKLQTLYSYVSRGLIRSVGQPGSKARLYLRADVERVQARAVARSGHGPAAAEAMNHGQPIIVTSVTDITEQGPSYRGRLAVELASQGASFESVAELLWSGHWNAGLLSWDRPVPSRDLVQTINTLGQSSRRSQLPDVFAMVVLHVGLAQGRKSQSAAAGSKYDDARQLIGVLVGCCGLASAQRRWVPLRERERICDGVLRAFGGRAGDASSAAVNAMLTLLADHELSPGTLAARVAASGGATLHSCVASGLCASSGVNVAYVFDQVDDFLAGARNQRGWTQQAMDRLARGVSLPGFNHPVYPRGDPRARALLAFIREHMPTRQLLDVCDFVTATEQRTGLHVRHEVPMVALCRAMGLPREAPSAIFLLALVAGWVAHIQEQRQSAQLLRPRARFVAPQPAMGALNDQS